MSWAAIAAKAQVDEKTVRQAAGEGRWNPTVDTLAKIEAIVPADWLEGDTAPEVEATRHEEAA